MPIKSGGTCVGEGRRRSDQATGGSHTADDGRGEGALSKSESAGGRAPREGSGGTLEEHCPGIAGEWGGGEFGDGESLSELGEV